MGTLGLLATTFYTFLPCFFFVFAGAPLVERTQDNPMIGGVLELITAVVGRRDLRSNVISRESVSFIPRDPKSRERDVGKGVFKIV